MSAGVAHSPNDEALFHSASDLTQAKRRESLWRLIAIAALALAAFGVFMGAIVSVTSHPQVLVYTVQPGGQLSYLGQASGAAQTPTEENIDAAIVNYLQCLRDIPGDPTLVQRNANCVLAATQTGSEAYTKFQTMWGVDANPLTLMQKGYTRTVEEADAHYTSGTSYVVKITEVVRRNGTVIARPSYNGTVTLAGAPQISTDPKVAQINPAGILVSNYDIAWSNPQ